MEDCSPTLREALEALAEQSLSEEAREALQKAARVVKQVDDSRGKALDEDRLNGGLIDPPKE